MSHHDKEGEQEDAYCTEIGNRASKQLLVSLKPWLAFAAEFGGVLYANHMRFDLCYPFIKCLLSIS